MLELLREMKADYTTQVLTLIRLEERLNVEKHYEYHHALGQKKILKKYIAKLESSIAMKDM